MKFPRNLTILATLALALGPLAPIAGAEEVSREYQKQLAQAAKETPLVVAALMHAREDARRFAQLATTLDAAIVQQSNAQEQACYWSCLLFSEDGYCDYCSQSPITPRSPCPSCSSVCSFASLLGTQSDCANCMIERGDNSCF